MGSADKQTTPSSTLGADSWEPRKLKLSHSRNILDINLCALRGQAASAFHLRCSHEAFSPASFPKVSWIGFCLNIVNKRMDLK